MVEKQSGDFLRASEVNELARGVGQALDGHGGRGRIGGAFGTQARNIPGGSGFGVEVWRIVAFTTGLFGVTNSGLSCKRPQDYSNAAIPPTPVFVFSYNGTTGHEAEVGRVNLANATPWGIGSYVRVISCPYVDGMIRLCLLSDVEECGV